MQTSLHVIYSLLCLVSAIAPILVFYFHRKWLKNKIMMDEIKSVTLLTQLLKQWVHTYSVEKELIPISRVRQLVKSQSDTLELIVTSESVIITAIHHPDIHVKFPIILFAKD